MLADAICLIPHRNICILISPLDESTRNRGCIRKNRLLIILCSVLIFSSHGPLLYVFFPNIDSPTIFCCATLCVVLPLCSCLCNVIWRSVLTITQCSFYHAASFFPLYVSFLLSVDICVSVAVPLSFTLFPLIPFPHTLTVLVLWAVYMCTEALETTFFSYRQAT